MFKKSGADIGIRTRTLSYWNLNPACLPIPSYRQINMCKLYLIFFFWLGRHMRLAADCLLLILLRLSSYSIISLFSDFRLRKGLAFISFPWWQICFKTSQQLKEFLLLCFHIRVTRQLLITILQIRILYISICQIQ